MKAASGGLLILSTAGMELSYLYACSTFLTTSILHQPFPFPEAVGSFVLAAMLTALSKGRGWRVINILLLQAIGFVPAFLKMLTIFKSWSASFLSQTWLVTSYSDSTFAIGWFISLLMMLWFFAFWVGGAALANRPKDYLTICSRFDRGLVVFFILYLIKFVLQIQGEVQTERVITEFSIFPFLIFSLLAIGLVRGWSTSAKDFLPGYQGLGVILTFIVVLLLVGTGLTFFCFPYLTLAAKEGYGILKVVAGPVISILGKLFCVVFGCDFELPEKLPEKKPPKMPEKTSQGPTPWWLELLEKIIAYGFMIFMGLLLLVIMGVALYYLYRWLSSKTEVDQDKQSPQYLVSRFFERLGFFLCSLWRALLRKLSGYRDAVQFYSALLRWGRHSGLHHFPSETPTEFGLRLMDRFPMLKIDIESIVKAFNEAVYGGTCLNEQQLTSLQSSWHKLCSPRYWPLRLKTWFRRPMAYEAAASFTGQKR